MQTYLERTLIFLGVLFYLFVFPHGTYGDGGVRFLALEALLKHGTWMAQKYPMIGPILSTPLYYLGNLYKEPHWWVSRYNAIVFLVGLFCLGRILKNYFSASSLRKLFLLFLTATMFSKHVTDFYGEVFTTVFAAVALSLLLVRKDKLGIGVMALSLMNTPPSLFSVVFSTSYFAFLRKHWRYFLPAAFGLALYLGENYVRFGHIFNNDYINNTLDTANILPYARTPGFSYPFFFGVLSIFLSFGKGILFFSPGLLIVFYTLKHLSKELQVLQKSWLLYTLGLVLIYAKWCAWPGDWFWGPRYFLFTAFPATLALHCLLEKMNKTLLQNLLLLVLLTTSVWVGLEGIAFGQNNLEACGANKGYLSFMCWYTPEFSALWRPFIAEKMLTGKQLAFTIYFSLVYIFLSYQTWISFFGQLVQLGREYKSKFCTLTEWRF